MIYTYPDYYKKFSCIADKCPDTCCGKWQIVIDDDSLEKYEDYNGEYRDELRRKVNWKEGVFRHGRSGKCAFLRDDMLCDMYIHMGKNSLCTTCREYPRHTEEFENVREVSLSLSCPEVARILMNITDKVTFVTEEDDEDEVFDDFDYFLYSNLEDILNEILSCQKPKVVVLDVDLLWEGMNNTNRLEKDVQSLAETYIPLIRYHDRWKSMQASDSFKNRSYTYRCISRGQYLSGRCPHSDTSAYILL